MVADKEILKGFQKTEVGIIPSDWVLRNIVENSTMKARIGWQGLTVAEYLNQGDYFLITGTDFFDGKIKWDTCHFVKRDRYSQDVNIQINVGDILITKDGTIGKVAYIDILPLPATLNSGVFVIRPKAKSYIPIYLFYIFNSFYFNKFLNKLVAGSTINHLYQKDFVSFNFPLPPTKEEQTAIATALNDADNLITELEKLIAKKKLIKQGAMQELLKPKEGWVEKKLGKIFDFKQGVQCPVEKQYFSPKPGLKRFIRIIDLTQPDEQPRYILDPGSNHHITSNDLFMVRYGTPGLLGFGFEGIIANNLFRLLPKQKLDSQFFFYILLYKNSEIGQIASSTTMAALNFTALREMEITYPSDIQSQTNISQILLDMDSEIESLEKKLDKYKMIKQGMMQNLLTGKIRLV